MLLTFGSEDESDLIGALSVPRSLASRKGSGAAASSRNRQSVFAENFSRGGGTCSEAKEIGNEFGRIADVAGLTKDERSALFGECRELFRIVLALETLGAALDLFHESDAAVA